MRTVAERREHFFVQSSLTAAVAVMVLQAAPGLILRPSLPKQQRQHQALEIERLLPIVKAEQVPPPYNTGGKPVRLRTQPAS